MLVKSCRIQSRMRSAMKPLAEGASLIELMVALFLGLMIMAAVVQLFAGSRTTYNTNEAVARVQESGRFAIELIREPIRTADNRGFCGGRPRLRNHMDLGDAEAEALLSLDQPVSGWEYDGTSPGDTFTMATLVPPTGSDDDWLGEDDLPATVSGRIVAGTDVLLLRSIELVEGVAPDNSNTAASANLDTLINHDVDQCGVVLVTNCTQADLFQNTSAASGSLSRASGGCSPGNDNPGQNWSTVFGEESQIYRPLNQILYVGWNADREEPGLYRITYRLGTGTPVIEELVEGVENMQIEYGYSFPGGGGTAGGGGQLVNRWLAAEDVPNWEYVISARLSLLVRSPGPVGNERVSQTFNVGGSSDDPLEIISPADRRLRNVFTTTVALRNRMIVR